MTRVGVEVNATLGKPAIYGSNFIVGTDHHYGHHYLLLVSALSLGEIGDIFPDFYRETLSFIINEEESTFDESSGPLLRYSKVNHQVRDILWVTPTMIICSTGNGLMHLYDIGDEGFSMRSTIQTIHNDCVREMAIQTFNQELLVASGGKSYI